MTYFPNCVTLYQFMGFLTNGNQEIVDSVYKGCICHYITYGIRKYFQLYNASLEKVAYLSSGKCHVLKMCYMISLCWKFNKMFVYFCISYANIPYYRHKILFLLILLKFQEPQYPVPLKLKDVSPYIITWQLNKNLWK